MSTIINVRQVYQHNLAEEFALIDHLLSVFRYIAIDTEFPGTVIQAEKPHDLQDPEESYQLMRHNVDATKIIQLGLTMCDKDGRLPVIGSDQGGSIWQFNFRFDVDVDLSNSESIEMLKKQGIEFAKHKDYGIDPEDFRLCFEKTRLGLSLIFFKKFDLKGIPIPYEFDYNPPVWVTFQGLSDLGYLLKILRRGKNLPKKRARSVFTFMLRVYFGPNMFDVKEMIKPLGIKGGLERVAGQLGVKRNSSCGKSHQGGSDSLLTLEVFLKLKEVYLACGLDMYRLNYKMHGLEEDELNIREAFIEAKVEYSRQIRNTPFCRPSVVAPSPMPYYQPYPTMHNQPCIPYPDVCMDYHIQLYHQESFRV